MAKNLIHGVVVAADHVAFTTMEPAKEAWRVVDQDRVPLEVVPSSVEGAEAAPPLDAAAPGSDALAKQLSALAPRLKGECNIALPAERLLIRVVDLPTTDADEIEAMIALQIEKISPFPVERLQVSYERLAETETTARVLIIGAQQEDVDRIGDLFHGAGLTPRWLDADILGWWHHLRKLDRVSKFGREVVLLQEEGRSTLIVAQAGAPLAIRALPDVAELTEDERLAVVVEEIDYTLTSLETEWGGVDHIHYAVWHAGAPPEALVSALREAVGEEVPLHSLEDLPPLSEALAERASEGGDGRVDLAPPAWEQADEARSTLRTMILAVSILLAIWVVLLGAFQVALRMRRSELARVRTQRQLLIEPVEQVRQTRSRVTELRKYTDRSSSALEVIREVAIAMPADIDLSSFTFTKGGSVGVHGEAGREDPIFQFMEKLQGSPLFSEVKLDRIEKRARAGEVRSVFRITARMRGEDAT